MKKFFEFTGRIGIAFLVIAGIVTLIERVCDKMPKDYHIIKVSKSKNPKKKEIVIEVPTGNSCEVDYSAENKPESEEAENNESDGEKTE